MSGLGKAPWASKFLKDHKLSRREFILYAAKLGVSSSVLATFGSLGLSSLSRVLASGLIGDYVVAEDGSYYQIDGYNQTRGLNQMVIYTPSWGASTKQNQWGAEAAVSNGIVVKISSVGQGGNMEIPSNGFAVSGYGPAAQWIQAHLSVGKQVEIQHDTVYQTEQIASCQIDAIDPQPPYQFPGGRGANQLIVYTPAYGQPSTGTNEYGIEAIAISTDSGYRVVSVGGNDSTIPANGLVISGHGTAKSWIQQNVAEGALVVVDGSTLTATLSYSSYDFAADRHIGIAERSLNSARTNYADAPLGQAAAKLSKAKQQLADARAAHERGDDRTAILTANSAVNSANEARQLTLESTAVEGRGVWHRPAETSPAEVEITVANMAATGFNQLFLETFYDGWTIYPSEFTEQNPSFADWDPLAAFVASTKKHGMELHLWVHGFFVGVESVNGQGPILKAHPDWAAVDRSGNVMSHTENGYYFLDPAIPAAQEYLV